MLLVAEKFITKMELVVHQRIWKGNGSFTLEKHIGQHRNAHVSMTQCSEHIPFQLPNVRTRVIWFVDSIQNSDPGLQAALAQVRSDRSANGLSNDFELAAAHIQPYDPVAKKRNASNKRNLADISDTSGTEAKVGAATASGKTEGGKTGVSLRYYTDTEYNKLSKAQKNELYELRQIAKQQVKASGGKQSGGKKDQRKWLDKTVASSLKAQLEAAELEEREESDLKTYVQSIVSEVEARP